MPRPSNSAERRAQIVRGLRRVMARQGYDGASTVEVARAAGLGPGLVHYHFADKREILLALLDDLAREADERGRRALSGAGDDAVHRLESYLDAFLSLETDPDPEAVACWIAIAAEAIRDARVRKAFGAALGRQLEALEGLVSAAAPRARRDPRLAKATAAALVATVQGYFLLSFAVPEAIPAGSASPVARRLARALIESEGS
jgi:TetR/AcrR family transcriptional repressor of bet genes